MANILETAALIAAGFLGYKAVKDLDLRAELKDIFKPDLGGWDFSTAEDIRAALAKPVISTREKAKPTTVTVPLLTKENIMDIFNPSIARAHDIRALTPEELKASYKPPRPPVTMADLRFFGGSSGSSFDTSTGERTIYDVQPWTGTPGSYSDLPRIW
jgi:hypothetical protein